MKADEPALLPVLQGLREIHIRRGLVEHGQLPDHHHQRQHQAGAWPCPQQQPQCHGSQHQALEHFRADPVPGMGWSIGQGGRQAARHHPHHQTQRTGQHALGQSAQHAERQQTRQQQAHADAQHLADRQKRLQFHFAHGQPVDPGRLLQRIGHCGFQPLEHLTQSEGHRDRKHEGHRPQCQQHQHAAGIGHEPPITPATPVGHQAPGREGMRQQGPEPGPEQVQPQIHAGGHPLGQEHLQRLHQERQ